MTLLINGGHLHIRLTFVKPTETSDLLQTDRDTSELKHTKVFNDVQSVIHNEIAVKKQQVSTKTYANNLNVMACPG